MKPWILIRRLIAKNRFDGPGPGTVEGNWGKLYCDIIPQVLSSQRLSYFQVLPPDAFRQRYQNRYRYHLSKLSVVLKKYSLLLSFCNQKRNQCLLRQLTTLLFGRNWYFL